MKRDFNRFSMDNYIGAYRNHDMIYHFLGDEKLYNSEKEIFKEINKYDLYEKINNHLQKNCFIIEGAKPIKPKKIKFHERFGWTLIGEKNKAYLGKASINGNVKIIVGKNSYISGFSQINGNKELRIGKFVSIASNTEFFTSNINHPINHVTSYNLESNRRLKEENSTILLPNFRKELEKLRELNSIKIANDVWIGRNVFIMPGVTIPNGCVVGAKSLVTKSLKPYGVYVGSPAKLIKFRFSKKIISQLENIKWWDWSLEKMRENVKFFDLDLSNYEGDLKEIIKKS